MARVLVAEHEESFSDALSYQLRRHGFEVAVCPTGPAALDAFDRHGADLVLLDPVLPGMAGTAVCQSLRERSDVPVIMLSAKDTEFDKAIGLQLGADDYVTKPFSWAELAARIRAGALPPERTPPGDGTLRARQPTLGTTAAGRRAPERTDAQPRAS